MPEESVAVVNPDIPRTMYVRTVYATRTMYGRQAGANYVCVSKCKERYSMAESAEPRLPWTRERVLRAAIDLADERGIESLSMRRLSQELGGAPMSLYNHVANKEDLLDGMIDVVFSEIELPSEEGSWKTAMRQRAISIRTVMSRHPWAIGLMESRTSPGPATLRHHDAVIGSLRDAGFSV